MKISIGVINSFYFFLYLLSGYPLRIFIVIPVQGFTLCGSPSRVKTKTNLKGFQFHNSSYQVPCTVPVHIFLKHLLFRSLISTFSAKA